MSRSESPAPRRAMSPALAVHRPHPAPEPAPAFRSQRYEVTGVLGQGGFGIVLEAIDRRRGCRVALKTLPALDAAALSALKREFRALSDVSHENLVHLHELVSEGGRWFFTM